MDNVSIKKIILSWQDRFMKTNGVKRHYEDDIISCLGSKPIKIITGFRRTGKSFISQMIAQRSVKDKRYQQQNILYLNFEDFRLSTIESAAKINEIFQLFKIEIAKPEKMLLIFDEIQNIKDWDAFIRTLYEMEDNIEIIITGSNSELLSSEISSKLAGRFISFFIYPFSFKEFLLYNQMTVHDDIDLLRKQEQLKRFFHQYVIFGGLPEIFSITSEDAKKSYLMGIISKVILDDIVKRFSIKHPHMIEKILHYIILNTGNLTAFSRIANYLKNQHISVSQDTIIQYVQYIIKTYALFEIQKFDWKQQRIFETKKKYYAVDSGLINFFDSTTQNYSKQIENIVYLHLRKSMGTVYFGSLKSGKEIDFITKNKAGIFDKYQVTLSITSENKKRELSPFTLSDQYLAKGKNYLLSFDDNEEPIHFQNTPIERKNIFRFLLEI